MANILLGCEFSGIVRDALRKRGHNAVSCDLQDTERPGPHIRGDVRAVFGWGWDAAIFFPPCTFLCSSGLHHNKRDPSRKKKTEQALHFVADILNIRCKRLALENSVGCISTRIKLVNGIYTVLPEPVKDSFPVSQSIQPNQFGEDASKRTCLWLRGLPLLKGTLQIAPRIVDGKPRWANQTDSGQNRLGPSETRSNDRSRTYHGIAEAMADQWGRVLEL